MTATLNKIDSIEQLDAIFEESHSQPVALFKHSNACGISSHILEQTRSINGSVNIVVIQEARQISNEIAIRTGHRHQSPQAFVLRNGKPIYHATHYAIDPVAIEEKLNS